MGGSNSRRARRLAAKGKGAKKLAGLARAGNQVGEALDMLRKIEGLEGSVKTLENVEVEITKANTLLEALVGDLNAVNAEVEAQREIMLRLLAEVLTIEGDSGVLLANLRQAEEHIRASILMGPKTESTDEGT